MSAVLVPLALATTAATTIASISAMRKKPGLPSLPKKIEPEKVEEETKAKARRRLRAQARQTILTSPLGIQEQPEISRPTLLGGGV